MNFKILKAGAVCCMILLAGGTAMAQSQKTKDTHNNAHKDLLANQKKTTITNKTQFIEYDEPEPEIDIWTEGWNSRRVNPFNEADVPATATIDVSNYCMPHNGRITSNYGYRPKFGRMHKGVDIGLNMNDTVRSAFDGKVRLTNYEAKGYGNYVIIRHNNGLETVYGHLNKALVKEDQIVKAGQPIGLGGNTGRSTGPHLHFETRYMGYAINPAGIFDFNNKTTHTDTYAFSKKTYQEARNYDTNNTTTANVEYKQGKSVDTYTVRSGDSIASIARSYGISVTTLRRLNSMSDTDRIKVGQVLKVK